MPIEFVLTQVFFASALLFAVVGFVAAAAFAIEAGAQLAAWLTRRWLG